MPPTNKKLNASPSPLADKTPVRAKKDAPVLPAGQSGSKSAKPQSLVLRIDDRWYDLTRWQHVHPGGTEILSHLHKCDATDAFYSIHSKEAIARLQRLHSTPVKPGDECTGPSDVDVNFRKLRQQLEKDGWFERNWFMDAFYLFMVVGLTVLGWYIAEDHPFLAILAVGVAMQQAGWAGHDYVHARGKVAWVLGRLFGGFNGFSSWWWSDKHNTHHVYPNTYGVDRDIANDPVFHIWYPEHDKDHWMRPYQHLYMVPAYSMLYFSWRMQSFKYAWATKNVFELSVMAVDYFCLFYFFPWYVVLGAIAVGGFLVAVIVTASHQSEDILDADLRARGYSYARDQFLSTRDAWSDNIVVNYIWGGMQYQLEHHLFPFMPKYRYRAVNKYVRQFAKDNGLEYRVDGIWEILLRNWNTLHHYAKEPPTTLDAPLFREETGKKNN